MTRVTYDGKRSRGDLTRGQLDSSKFHVTCIKVVPYVYQFYDAARRHFQAIFEKA